MGSRIYGGQVGGDASLHYLIELLSSCETRPWRANSLFNCQRSRSGEANSHLSSLCQQSICLECRSVSLVLSVLMIVEVVIPTEVAYLQAFSV